jgi:hypothetical protein
MNQASTAEPMSELENFGFTFDFVERIYPAAEVVDLPSGGRIVVAPQDCLLPGFVIDVQIPGLLPKSAQEIQQLTSEMNERSSGFLWFTDDAHQGFHLAWRARLPSRPVCAMFAWAEGEAPTLGSSGLTIRGLDDVGLGSATSVVTELTAKPVHLGGWTEEGATALVEKGYVLGVFDEQALAGLVTTHFHRDGLHVSVGGRLGNTHHNSGLEADALRAAATHFASQGKRVVTGVANADDPALKVVTDLNMRLIKRGWSAQLGTF